MPVSDAKVHIFVERGLCAHVIVSRCLYSFTSNFLFILPKLLCSRTSAHVRVNYSPLNMLKL